MKKLLLLMALAISGLTASADTAVFYASGAPDDATYSTQLSGTIANTTVTAGDVKAQFVKNNTNSSNVNSNLVRFYANDEIVISAAEENTEISITKIVVNCSSTSYAKMSVKDPNGSFTGTTTLEWSSTNGVNSVTLVATAQSRFSYFEVTYTLSAADDRQPAGLAFAEEAYTANLGEDFTAPELTNPNGLEVTYKSSNEAVATVATDGNITILAAGTTTITATSAETEEFKAGEASYTLSVIDPNAKEATFNFSEMGYSNTDVVSKCQSGIVTLDLAAGSNSNPPKYYNTGTGVRLYGGNTLTVSVPNGYYLTEISFTTDSSSNSSFNSGTTATAGSFSGLSWTASGQNNTVTITNGGSSGHVRIQTITVKYAEIPSGIADIEAEENGVVEYFNLQGVRVDEPANGLYIRRAGNKVEKVIVR